MYLQNISAFVQTTSAYLSDSMMYNMRDVRRRALATPDAAISIVLVAFLLVNCTLASGLDASSDPAVEASFEPSLEPSPSSSLPDFCPETSARNPRPVPAQSPQMVGSGMAEQCTNLYRNRLNALDYISCMFPKAGFDRLSAENKNGIDDDGEKGPICATHDVNGTATTCCFQPDDSMDIGDSRPDPNVRGIPTVKLVCVPNKSCTEQLFPTCQQFRNFCAADGPDSSLSQERCKKTWGVELCLSNTCFCGEDLSCLPTNFCTHPCSDPMACVLPLVGVRRCCGKFNISRRQCWWRRRNGRC